MEVTLNDWNNAKYSLLEEIKAGSVTASLLDNGDIKLSAPEEVVNAWQTYVTDGAAAKAQMEAKMLADQQKITGFDFNGVMCSATGDDQNGLIAVWTHYQMDTTNFQPTQFVFSNGNELVIDSTNIADFAAQWVAFRQQFFSGD